MKNLISVLITATIALTLFTACVADKTDKTVSSNPTKKHIATVQDETKNIAAEEKTDKLISDTEKQTAKEKHTEKVVPSETVGEYGTDRDYERKTERKENNTPDSSITPKTSSGVTGKADIISANKAKEIVLVNAKVNEADIRFYHTELDRERKTIVYEIEFVSDKYEYDYEVNAETGKIIKAEKEFRD